MRWLLFVLSAILIRSCISTLAEDVRGLIRDWAPLVWLAPGERFLPLGVTEFLDNMQADDNYLRTRISLQSLLLNRSSFLHGREPVDNVPIYALLKHCVVNSELTPSTSIKAMMSTTVTTFYNPKKNQLPSTSVAIDNLGFRFLDSNNLSEKVSPPTLEGKRLSRSQSTKVILAKLEPSKFHEHYEKKYRKLKLQTRQPWHFHVTYWMFYPFSEGKAVCVLDLGILGSWPIPSFGGTCFGRLKEYGSHVGDWEHVSLYFKGKNHPLAMYVSAHDAGAFYRYEPRTGNFVYESQEIRKGIFQKPIFPERVFTLDESHPVLFSARGSHGLWTAPGKHKFVRLPKLYDESGFGTPWSTWKKVEVLSMYENHVLPKWMSFTGKWGNPKSNCHPLAKLGFDICEFVDGPTGIPMKKMNFRC